MIIYLIIAVIIAALRIYLSIFTQKRCKKKRRTLLKLIEGHLLICLKNIFIKFDFKITEEKPPDG